MYSVYIIYQSAISNYSVRNQLDIVMDTVENLTQIGQWTLGCYQKERNRIDLYLSLTRKNLNALLGFPLSPAFGRNFQKFSLSFSKLEEEYRTGKVDRTVWANRILECGNDLTRYSESV